MGERLHFSAEERYAVSKYNIIKLIQPGNADEQLTEILRDGARALFGRGSRGRGRGLSRQARRFEDRGRLLSGWLSAACDRTTV